jgi:hypothetical protein
LKIVLGLKTEEEAAEGAKLQFPIISGNYIMVCGLPPTLLGDNPSEV